MEELLALLLTSPAVRGLLEHMVVKIVAEVFHRRSTDPEYLKRSDEAFLKIATAKTTEERICADRELSNLLSS